MRDLLTPNGIRRAASSVLVIGLVSVLSAPLVQAQGTGGAAQAGTRSSQATVITTDQGAEFVREQFYSVLRQYSPSLGQVLRLDPGLMSREDYLAPYPAVATFLKEHPEILRNPDYYLARFGTSYFYSDPRSRAWENIFDAFSVFVVVLTIVGALGWAIRTAMDYRRWGRQAKVQAEAHTKLLDRLTSNDELLAYVQSPAGSRFLQSAPISVDGGSRGIASPLSRILWSMQAGVVLAAAGIGMNYVSGRVHPDSADPIFTLSVILLSLGIGFFVSAGLSFALSKRLGLLSFDRQDNEA